MTNKGQAALAVANYLGLGKPPQQQPALTALTPAQVDPLAMERQALMERAREADTINRVAGPLKLLAVALGFGVAYDHITKR